MEVFITFIISLLLLRSLMINAQQKSEQRFAIEPADKTAIVGDTIILPCRVINKVGQLQWTKDGFGLGIDRDLNGFPRYQMVGNDDEGDYSLQINDIQLDDDATYQCQVGASKTGQTGIRSKFARLNVLVAPKQPEIIQSKIYRNNMIQTTEGNKIELVCESNAGKPPGEIKWLIVNQSNNETIEVTKGLESTIQLLDDNKRSNSMLKWTFNATKDLNNKLLICRSENSAMKSPLNTSIKIQVKYKPKVDLVIESHNKSSMAQSMNHDSMAIHVNDSLQFYCKSDANPSHVIYKWYRNGQIINDLELNSNRLLINRVTKEFNSNLIECRVENSIGFNSSSFKLSVKYPPTFLSPVDAIIGADFGSDVRLNCLIDGNPQPDIVWLHNNESSKVLQIGKELAIKSIDYSKIGRYICRASSQGFAEIQSSTYLFIKGPPQVKGPTIQYGIEGQPSQIECQIDSIPSPNKIIWQRNDAIIDIDNRFGYELVQEPIIGQSILKSIIVIHKTKLDDFGVYNCTVWNEFGFDSRIITFVQKTSFESLALSVATVLTLIFIVIIMTIVMILCLNKRQSSFDNHSNNNNNEDDINNKYESSNCDSNSNESSTIKYELTRTDSSLSNHNQQQYNNYYYDDFNNIYNQYKDQIIIDFPPSDHQYHQYYLNSIDPRYHARYANPYLRTSTTTTTPPSDDQLSAGVYSTTSANNNITQQHLATHV